MKELSNLRAQINSIDSELISLLSKRMLVSERIGRFKKKSGTSPLDPGRWKEVLSNRVELGSENNLSEELIESVWNAIHKESLGVQE